MPTAKPTAKPIAKPTAMPIADRIAKPTAKATAKTIADPRPRSGRQHAPERPRPSAAVAQVRCSCISGMTIAMTTPATTTARATMINGSITEVSFWVARSTSSS